MAKIALISENWTEPIEALAKSLKEQKHEVLFVTGRNTLIENTLDLQVLAYFKNWTAWEAIKLFPRLLSNPPEIWHFIFTNPQVEKPKSAHWAIAGLARSLPHRAVAASLYGSVLAVKDFSWKPFFRLCHFVTLGTRESLMSFKRRGFLTHHSAMEVLPPLLRTAEATDSAKILSDQVDRLTRALHPYFLIFSDRLPSELKQGKWLSPYRLLVLGTRSKSISLPHCFFLSEKLNAQELELLAKKSKAILVAFDDLSLLELIRIHNIAISTGAYLIVNPRQIELYPGLCIHKKTGWVIEPRIEDFKRLLNENPSLTLPLAKWNELIPNSIDSTMNELHRLYTQALR